MKKTSRRDFLKTAGAILAAAPVSGSLLTRAAFSQSHFPRMLILGIDGMDHRLLGKFMKEGLMPNFAKLASQGGFSPLWIDAPPGFSNIVTPISVIRKPARPTRIRTSASG